MSFSDEPRYRVNAKQNSKNRWQLDVTVEARSSMIKISTNDKDPGDYTLTDIGAVCLHEVKKTEAAFRADGRKMVGDNNEAA